MAEVLVIEDEEGIQQLMHRVLSRMGHDVTLASNGLQAVQAAHTKPFTVILSDFTLPGEPTGLELVEALRECQPEARMAVITGLADLSRAQALQAMGVRHILRKPFDLTELKQLVNELLISPGYTDPAQ